MEHRDDPQVPRTPIRNNQRPPKQQKSTPIVKKWASNPDPGRATTHTLVDPVLKAELNDAIEAKDISLVQQLFPDSALPYRVSTAFESLVSAKLRSDTTWTFLPSLDVPGPRGVRESELAKFLNDIVNHVKEKVTPRFEADNFRTWSADYATMSLLSLGPWKHMARNPDLFTADASVLVDGSMVPRFSWRIVRSLLELKSGEFSTDPAMLLDFWNKCLCIFQSQDNRRYILMLSIQQFNLFIAVVDRSGTTRTEKINMNAQPLIFLRFLLGLTFADDTRIGLDPTITEENGSRFLEMRIGTFQLARVAFRAQMIRGRGTTCWIATRTPNWYAIKDIWVHAERKPTEPYFLMKARKYGVKNILTLLDWEIVKIDGRDDSTENNRGSSTTLENRVHRRLLFRECGVPITEFQSMRELVSALKDAIEAHHDLVMKAGIMHRDISPSNILLKMDYSKMDSPHVDDPYDKTSTSKKGKSKRQNTQPSSFLEPHPGILIDLDYAVDLPHVPRYELVHDDPELCEDGERSSLRGHRTGTRPFMAVDILMTEEPIHRPQHDLESFFYLLLYICYVYEFPGKHRPPPEIFDTWLGDNYSAHWLSKFGILNLPKSKFLEDTGSNFTKYFSSWKDHLNTIREIFKTTNVETLTARLKNDLAVYSEMKHSFVTVLDNILVQLQQGGLQDAALNRPKPKSSQPGKRKYTTQLLEEEDEMLISPGAQRKRVRASVGEELPTATRKRRSALQRGISDVVAGPKEGDAKYKQVKATVGDPRNPQEGSRSSTQTARGIGSTQSLGGSSSTQTAGGSSSTQSVGVSSSTRSGQGNNRSRQTARESSSTQTAGGSNSTSTAEGSSSTQTVSRTEVRQEHITRSKTRKDKLV